MKINQSQLSLRELLYSFVIISLILQECAGNHPFVAKVKQSPLGIGASSAFHRHGNLRSLLSSSSQPYCKGSQGEQSEKSSMVPRNERNVNAYRINAKPEQYENDDQSELDALLSSTNSVLLASRTNGKIPSIPLTKGGAIAAARPLFFWESMVSGAISRSIAQTAMHPANTMKTIMQSSRGGNKIPLAQLMKPSMFKTLSRGAGANFVLSVPHGAINFAVLEFVRAQFSKFVDSVPALSSQADRIGPGLDFLSSAVSTICCSVISTPQMMITDNIMAGNYPSMLPACKGLYQQNGVLAFYSGWWPGLAGKIPSYALTWTFFQKVKDFRNVISDRAATNTENTIMGCIASTATVCIMMPMDTIKTRLVTQNSAAAAMNIIPYKGIIDCAVRITKEEGFKTFYSGLAPRLLSVVPMIGIQFGVYEAMKKVMLQRNADFPATATTIS